MALLCMVSGELYAQQVEVVDLGLSVNWANMNVGAKSPEDYGDYFAWGEVSAKRYYGLYSKYKHFEIAPTSYIYSKYNYLPLENSVMDELLVLQPVDDAASKCMGKGWRMPTEDEMNELLDTAKCVISMGKLNGTRGLWVTRRVPKPKMDNEKARRKSATVKNDSLFLPFAGYKEFGAYRFFPGTQGYYWTSTLIHPDSVKTINLDTDESVSAAKKKVRTAMCLMYSGSVPVVDFYDRRNGCVIRAVRNK